MAHENEWNTRPELRCIRGVDRGSALRQRSSARVVILDQRRADKEANTDQEIGGRLIKDAALTSLKLHGVNVAAPLSC